MGEIWIVIAVCASLKGQCAWSPPEILPSRAACIAYGRKVQIERKLSVKSFRCLKVEVRK